MTEGYVELHAASAFSFLEGANQPEKLVERAFELEMPAMALLDRNGVYGSARFHTSAQRNGVHAHVGAEIAVASLGQRLTPPAWLPHQIWRSCRRMMKSTGCCSGQIRLECSK
jgi:error-prone DNA polymerase